ncbi:MAG TPA: A/G-specific adenine glycosylase [Novosphingobium sp.]|nr:A/G-specific adenine glycosylase [Novosphingobium sp.]
MQASEDDGTTIAGRLLAWYDAHARALPWRAPPGAPPPSPYRVWLSEVMLQQTTTAHAAPFFAAFLARWPTVEALASASEADVMSAWAGLGYYRRARNLHACAREVVSRGGFPTTEAELRRLPGVGDYTAAAIAGIAFGSRAVAVDANVERVVARLFAISEPLPAGRRAIRAGAERLTPTDRAGDFAQAMMDLGATICTPRDPRCLLCPLRADCAGYACGAPEAFPGKAAKRAKPRRVGGAFWIERDGAVWLVTRRPSGMLGAMRALPDDGWSAALDGDGTPPLAGEWRPAGTVRHGFTHFDLELQLMLFEGAVCVNLEGGEWWPLAKLDEAGLPTLFAKAARLAFATRQSEPAE